jgi:DNA polymerase-3 subunit epsilon
MRLRRDSLARSRRRARERVAPGPLRDALVVPLPDADVATGQLPLLAVDIETTGLDAGRDRVLSIGWVPVDGRGVVLAGARYRVVRPEGDQAVGSSATVHGLTDDEVAAGSRWPTLSPSCWPTWQVVSCSCTSRESRPSSSGARASGCGAPGCPGR